MFKVVLDQSGHMLELPFLAKIEDCSSAVMAFETFEIEIVYKSRTLSTVQLCSMKGSVRVIGLRGEEACGRERRSRKAELSRQP